MTKFTTETLPEYFQFQLNNSKDATIFNAVYPKNEFGYVNNKVYVGWVKEGEPRATYYFTHHAVELIECGSWNIINN